MKHHLAAIFAGFGVMAALPFMVVKPAAAPVKSAPALTLSRASAAQRSVNVTKLYDDTCSHCHGANGQGGGAGTKTLNTVEKFDQSYDALFFDSIKNGVKSMGMESYGATLSDEEIWSLVVHIREMQSRALRQENGDPKATNGVYHAKNQAFKIETVIPDRIGLKVPWAIDWLPNGKMLITNRPGKLFVASPGKLETQVEGTPATVELGQGGMLDIAVHPDYAKNGWIYMSFTDPDPKNPLHSGFTKIVRGKLKFTGTRVSWIDQQTVWQATPENYNGSGVHFGDRIVFDRKGHVFFTLGERGNGPLAQDLTKPNGKVHRVNEDGTIPSDNPFADPTSKAKGYVPSTWSFGHRNPQGLVMGLDGVLWDTEHGPRGGDELNHILPSHNYGWPLVAFSINYNDSPLVTPWPKDGQNITLPVFRWLPSIAPCGLAVGPGTAFKLWRGDLFAGGLAGQTVERVRVRNDKVVEHEELFHNLGRVRDVNFGPDGNLYVVLNDPDKVIRLVPVKD